MLPRTRKDPRFVFHKRPSAGIMIGCQPKCHSERSHMSQSQYTRTQIYKKEEGGSWKGSVAVTMCAMLMGALIFACGLHFGRAEQGLEVFRHKVGFTEWRSTELFLWILAVLLLSITIILVTTGVFLKRKGEETSAEHLLKIPSESLLPTVDTCAKIAFKTKKLPKFSDVDTGESVSYTMIRTRDWALCDNSSMSVSEAPLKEYWEDGSENGGSIEMVKEPLDQGAHEGHAGEICLGELVSKMPRAISRDSHELGWDGALELARDSNGQSLCKGSQCGESLESGKQRKVERCEQTLRELQEKERELKQLEEENKQLAKEAARKVQGKTPLERERELDEQIQSLEKVLAEEALKTAELTAELEQCRFLKQSGIGDNQ